MEIPKKNNWVQPITREELAKLTTEQLKQLLTQANKTLEEMYGVNTSKHSEIPTIRKRPER